MSTAEQILSVLYGHAPIPELPVNHKTKRKADRNAEIITQFEEGASLPSFIGSPLNEFIKLYMTGENRSHVLNAAADSDYYFYVSV